MSTGNSVAPSSLKLPRERSELVVDDGHGEGAEEDMSYSSICAAGATGAAGRMGSTGSRTGVTMDCGCG